MLTKQGDNWKLIKDVEKGEPINANNVSIFEKCEKYSFVKFILFNKIIYLFIEIIYIL